MQKYNDGRDWFFEKPFGMFIHWGLYSIPAWHEQIQWRKGLDRGKYAKLINEFNPVKFNPDAWLDIAESAGMEYITVTSKHHDGFCLWDTKYTDYNVMNSPYGKDIIAMLAEACHRRNFPLRFYYSIPDWHHPNYPNRGNQGIAHELPEPLPGDEPSEKKYMEYVINQIRELCTNYGKIHGIWWDVNRLTYRDVEINKMIHELQPDAVINDRGFSEGDFATSERDYSEEELSNVRHFTKPIEACQSLGMESWGYRENEFYYTEKYLMQSIDKMMAKGAFYLLNVGPKPDGTIADEDKKILSSIGNWYGKIKDSLVGVEQCSQLTDNASILLTSKDNSLYVHLFEDPKGSALVLDPISALPCKATLLNTGEELEFSLEDIPRFFRLGKKVLCIKDLPVKALREEVMVIKLDFTDISELSSGTKTIEFEG